MQRVEELPRRDRVLADVSRDVMDGASAQASPVNGECRRLGERLGLDAVGIIQRSGSARRMEWWMAPGSAPLPDDPEDIVGRLVDGWIVHPISEDAVVLARTTPETSPRAATLLGPLAASLANR